MQEEGENTNELG